MLSPSEASAFRYAGKADPSRLIDRGLGVKIETSSDPSTFKTAVSRDAFKAWMHGSKADPSLRQTV
jgi:hypothetical protein